MKEGSKAVFIGKGPENPYQCGHICCNEKPFVIGSSTLVALDTNICLGIKEVSTLALPKFKNVVPEIVSATKSFHEPSTKFANFPILIVVRVTIAAVGKVTLCFHVNVIINYLRPFTTDSAFYFELR